MISFFWSSGISSKSQLSNRNCVLVCQISTVFSSCVIIGITIAFSSTCTAVGHSTRTFSTVDCRSFPDHFPTLTWYPPTNIVSKQSAMMIFIFYKLFTILGLVHNGNNLFHGNVIVNLSFVRTYTSISLHKCSWFIVTPTPFFDVIPQYTCANVDALSPWDSCNCCHWLLKDVFLTRLNTSQVDATFQCSSQCH